jgi:hypothetical protein
MEVRRHFPEVFLAVFSAYRNMFPFLQGTNDIAPVAITITAHQHIFDDLIPGGLPTVQDHQLATLIPSPTLSSDVNQIHAKG